VTVPQTSPILPKPLHLQPIEDSTKLVVAAIHGTALGGGFEITLACHACIMVPDTAGGLPEVKLGLSPDAARSACRASSLDTRDISEIGAGPTFEADQIGLDTVLADVHAIQAFAGPGYEPVLLPEELVQAKLMFADFMPTARA
jgi:hypothetical protein